MSLLDRVQSGVVERPISLIVHGPAGCGKSTFASGAPDPLFIDCDNRTAHLDVRRIIPETWDEILEVFRLVAKGELKCGTIVIDTLDHAELIMHRDLCKQHGVNTIEEVSGGYGKGYVTALGEWRKLGVALDAVRARGVNVVMLAHSADKVFKNATGEDYARVEIKLDKRAHGFLRERVDGVGYASFETLVVKSKGAGQTKAKTTGKATLTFAPNPAIETKRFSKFPEACALSWEAFTNKQENK